MDIFPHVNLILIMLWLVFFVIVPAWCELKTNPFRGIHDQKEQLPRLIIYKKEISSYALLPSLMLCGEGFIYYLEDILKNRLNRPQGPGSDSKPGYTVNIKGYKNAVVSHAK